MKHWSDESGVRGLREAHIFPPIMMKPTTTAPGPPVWKAPPLPMKRPAPMAPPLGSCQFSTCRIAMLQNGSHSNHLHVATLQVPVQLGLISLNHSNISTTGAELATLHMLFERRWISSKLLIPLLHVCRIRSVKAGSSPAAVHDGQVSRVASKN